ncbi:MAG: hypothetical protein M3342_13375 [Bacteroidota bacterium]|nr:hypothetical protein [Flavisolibacter sp.]MDQ3844986.1 hypothetical protein [Bacteroidota bacterium]
MKKFFTIIPILLLATVAYSQKLSQVRFENSTNLSYFSFLTDQGVLIRVSVDGKVLEWGTEVMSDRGNYYAPKLQPFMGRVEYYGAESDTTSKGKVKSIGSSFLSYYGAYEEGSKRGKLKALGSLQFDYYSNYDEKNLQGKLKMIGTYFLEYYGQFENEAVRGKLKSIGNMPITYYSPFEDRYNAGKLKSIGTVSYAWYSEYDRAKGALKSNNYRATVGGITFVLQ